MGSLMRSEEMSLCQIFLQSESAYACVSELGELGLCQFRDLNPDVSAFSRKFVSEVRRCDEMERKLRFIDKEIKTENIPRLDTGENPDAPAPREVIDLEASFEKLDNELREVNSNSEALKKNYLELTELKHILRKTQHFFDEVDAQFHSQRFSPKLRADDERGLLEDISPYNVGQRLRFVAGVILRERVPSFERMLWRACRGNVFLKQSEIDTPLEDPHTGDPVHKCVFVIFFQGDQLKSKVKKICEGYRATLYPCSESAAERREMSMGVMTRIEDLNTVLQQTTDHRYRVLVLASKNIHNWFIKVKKIKAIYHTLNMFNLDVTQKALIAECWIPTSDLDQVQHALQRGQEKSGGTVPNILNRMGTSRKPPTFHRTNKFTQVFQTLIDSYGVATYREVNPAAFSLITFPFLFAVMFGDFGHGFIMFLVGLWMVVRERQLLAKHSENEIWNMFFGGRYLIMMMGLFSIFTGVIYNDIFSKSTTLFGISHFRAPQKVYDYGNSVMSWPNSVTLTPSPFRVNNNGTFLYYEKSANGSTANYLGKPYPFGLDPIWAIAGNKLTFINSYKMKMSVILGVFHMMSGVFLSLINHRYFKRPLDIYFEFIPQVLFLTCTFVYLVFEIFFKWIMWDARQPKDFLGTGCAPNLLIGMINMYLMGGDTPNGKHCYPNNPVLNYHGQNLNGTYLQYFLVAVIVLCIPWMLIPKPYFLWKRGFPQKKSANRSFVPEGDQTEIIHHDQVSLNVDDEEENEHEEGIGDVVVHQIIHTIEYCLGCISHTASYLRLWALSLAHGQLSEVLWNMVLRIGLAVNGSAGGAVVIMLVFPFWALLSVGILICMEGLSAFLHTLRLHWVEFNSKFYSGEGLAFEPFSFELILSERESKE